MWLAYAFLLTIFPVPVTLNLFAAARFVFNFGIFSSKKSIVLALCFGLLPQASSDQAHSRATDYQNASTASHPD